jgi:peptidoglycan/LPS O-acetylase OafA/YrhL
MDKTPRPTLTYEAYQARKYLPELDGLRALSVLMVVSVHMHDKPTLWHFLAGWQGVTIFFVLSGYLITMLALREERARGSVSLSAFYVRRSFRIFPLYYFVLVLYCLLIFTPWVNTRIDPQGKKIEPMKESLPWYLLYMQEVPHFYGVTIPGDPNAATKEEQEPHTTHTDIPFYQSWSLGVEEKFYLVWPLLAFVLLCGRRGPRFVDTLLLVLLFALIRPLLSFDAALGRLGDCLNPYYSILVGCLLALLLEDRLWYERLRFLGTTFWTGLCLALFLFLHFARPQIYEESGLGKRLGYLCDTGYVVAVTLFLTCILLREGRTTRALRWAPLVLIGKLSYGIYLIHILCLNAVQKVLPPQFDAGQKEYEKTFGKAIDEWNPGQHWEVLGDAFRNHAGSVAIAASALLLACVVSVAAAWVLSLLIEKPCIAVGQRWSKQILSKGGKLEPKKV